MSEGDELKEAVEKVLQSKGRKKLVVAGPGAGKTTLFQKLLDLSGGSREQRLVLTFINTLRDDLERSLGSKALVNTLHGYCLSLLYTKAALRRGLTGEFLCHPGLISIIKQDWTWLKNENPPTFVDRFRALDVPEKLETFYMLRAAYYDAVDFDDTVYRVYRGMEQNAAIIPEFALLLVDEFQDFNKMEAGVIRLLAERSPIVIAGDDDQALYSKLRDANWEHIRAHHRGGQYEVFELPFCMRCPEVIVVAVNEVVSAARKIGKLVGRIAKPFRYFEPVKGQDSRRFPQINVVRTTVQRKNANYFGRYIAKQIRAISEQERKFATENFEPVALIIGSKPYLPMIEDYLTECGLYVAAADEKLPEREKALKILHRNPNSNLGWRIILAESSATFAKPIVVEAAAKEIALAGLISSETREAVLKEAAEFVAKKPSQGDTEEAVTGEQIPAIKLVSFEGSKGLSAQYVFIVGLHEGELPRSANPQDIEICKFLVALTRTKKECSILITKNFAGNSKNPSSFFSWIRKDHFNLIEVNAGYWKS